MLDSVNIYVYFAQGIGIPGGIRLSFVIDTTIVDNLSGLMKISYYSKNLELGLEYFTVQLNGAYWCNIQESISR